MHSPNRGCASKMDEPRSSQENRFEAEAEQSDVGFLREFVQFLRENKKWWLIPLVGSLLLIGVISVLAGSGAAPFIYTLF